MTLADLSATIWFPWSWWASLYVRYGSCKNLSSLRSLLSLDEENTPVILSMLMKALVKLWSSCSKDTEFSLRDNIGWAHSIWDWTGFCFTCSACRPLQAGSEKRCIQTLRAWKCKLTVTLCYICSLAQILIKFNVIVVLFSNNLLPNQHAFIRKSPVPLKLLFISDPPLFLSRPTCP